MNDAANSYNFCTFLQAKICPNMPFFATKKFLEKRGKPHK